MEISIVRLEQNGHHFAANIFKYIFVPRQQSREDYRNRLSSMEIKVFCFEFVAKCAVDIMLM